MGDSENNSEAQHSDVRFVMDDLDQKDLVPVELVQDREFVKVRWYDFFLVFFGIALLGFSSMLIFGATFLCYYISPNLVPFSNAACGLFHSFVSMTSGFLFANLYYKWIWNTDPNRWKKDAERPTTLGASLTILIEIFGYGNCCLFVTIQVISSLALGVFFGDFFRPSSTAWSSSIMISVAIPIVFIPVSLYYAWCFGQADDYERQVPI